jgi:hypothetical protein
MHASRRAAKIGHHVDLVRGDELQGGPLMADVQNVVLVHGEQRRAAGRTPRLAGPRGRRGRRSGVRDHQLPGRRRALRQRAGPGARRAAARPVDPAACQGPVVPAGRRRSRLRGLARAERQPSQGSRGARRHDGRPLGAPDGTPSVAPTSEDLLIVTTRRKEIRPIYAASLPPARGLSVIASAPGSARGPHFGSVAHRRPRASGAL